MTKLWHLSCTFLRPVRPCLPPQLRSLAPAFLLLLPFLVSCGTETPPRLTDAGPRPAEVPRRTTRKGGGAAGAVLAASGRQSYQGPTQLRCVPHAAAGLQLNFRTGDLQMPAVALRIEDFGGSGPYRARLFVTGRSRAGALATSTGEANVEVARRTSRQQGALMLLSGSFEGVYRGPAGKGSIEGRFETCSYPADRASPPPTHVAAGP